jgi:hypothetical protein
MREFGRLGEMLGWEVRKMNPEKLKNVREVILQAQKGVEEIMQDQQETAHFERGKAK